MHTKRKLMMAGVAAVLFGGLLASVALTSAPQVGVLVSDATAATIRGGCSGEDDYTCKTGACTGGLVSKAGTQFPSYDATTNVYWCDTGDHSCGSCYGSRICSSGPA